MNEYELDLGIICYELNSHDLSLIPHIDSFIDRYSVTPENKHFYLLSYKKAYVLEYNNQVDKAWEMYHDILNNEAMVEIPVLINVYVGAIRCARILKREQEADELQRKLIGLHK